MREGMKARLLGVSVTVGLLIILSFGWLYAGRFEEETDNAYLRADITSIAPKVSGYVVDVDVADNETVEAGNILFRIDGKDYRTRLARAEADVASAQASLLNVDAERDLQESTIAQSEAQLDAALATQKFAVREFERYRSLVRTNVVSRAQLEQREAASAQADAAVGAARAAVQVQRKKLNVLAAGREAARAALSQAEASRALAQIDLDNTIVHAPIGGVVGNRQVRVGRFVTAGMPLLDLVPVRHVWVVANFKESQLEHVRVGQPVRVTVDAYPHAEVRGVVDSLSPGSGAAFSLIPPDSATGNFVRVVQRVPVKIRLTNVVPQLRLVPGLSAHVTIDTSGAEE